MKLILEKVYELEILQEENKKGSKDYYIHGIFAQANVPNRNGRFYPDPVLTKEFARYDEEYVQTNRALGELCHPNSPSINLDRASHIVKEIKKDGLNFYGKAKLLDTQHGKLAKTFIEEGVQLGVSTRGVGSIVPRRDGINEVQSDFHLCAIDIVADPSAPEAFVNGIMENKEWVWDNGLIKESVVSSFHNAISKASQKRLVEEEVKAWQQFLEILKKTV